MSGVVAVVFAVEDVDETPFSRYWTLVMRTPRTNPRTKAPATIIATNRYTMLKRGIVMVRGIFIPTESLGFLTLEEEDERLPGIAQL